MRHRSKPQSRELAERKAGEAAQAQNVAETQTTRADERAEELRRGLYLHSIAPAQNAHEGKNLAHVKQLLGDCPADLRAWEWHRLMWLAKRKRCMLSLRGHKDRVSAVAFSPDSTRILSASYDKTLKVWSPTNGDAVLTLEGHENAVVSAAYSRDGKRIVSGSHDKTLRLWDPVAGKETLTLRGYADRVSSVAFSPDGTSIISSRELQFARTPRRR